MSLTLLVPEELNGDPSEPITVEAIETKPAESETKPAEHETKPAEPETHDANPDQVAAFRAWHVRTSVIETEISDLTIEKAKLSERAKSIKKRIDCLAEELQELRVSGPMAILSRDLPATEAAVIPPTTLGAAIVAADNAWRAARLTDLELKPNVHDKLLEAGIETVGQLEDLRADISIGKAKWPKGIGAAKITEIEDAVILWLTKNRDSAVFAGNSVTGRAVLLNTGEEGCLDCKYDDGKTSKFWDSGYEAANLGREITDCAYVPGAEQDDWIRGFLACELLSRYETTGSEPAESSPAMTTPKRNGFWPAPGAAVCSVEDL